MQRDFPASVFEVVLSGRLNGLGRRMFYSAEDRRAAEANLERMGMAELKNKCYQELSGGQQQRVLLARALCATKKLLLLDEPVAGLDPLATVEMYNLLKLINLCDGITVVMVSHDVEAALRYATHILHLGHSQIFFGTSAKYAGSDADRRLRGGGR
jgi:zinc transport system ATP-binding protein